jgi:hypothetical protein
MKWSPLKEYSMTQAEAQALETWIHDHDTRFEAKAMTNDGEHFVQLTAPEDGTVLPPVRSIEDYGAQYIEQGESTPTIREKWTSWLQERTNSP